MPKIVNGAEFGRLLKVSRQAIDEARKIGKVYRDPVTKKYDLEHSTNALYLRTNSAVSGLSLSDIKDVSEDLTDLYQIKLEAEIRRIVAQAEKYELQLARDKKDLIPIELVAILLGNVRSGISTNLLNIGKRVARGNLELQDRIEKEITRGLQATKDMSARAVQQFSKRVVQEMEEVEKHGTKYYEDESGRIR